MKRKEIYLLLLLVLAGYYPGSLLAKDIQLVNTGAVNVHTGGIVYVEGDMQMKNVDASREVSVLHDGTTALTGSFYHDARKNVFKTENDDWSNKNKARGITSSTGRFKFVKDTSGKKRYITSSEATSFDRISNYIAFPNLRIVTNDTIYIPETMGLDSRTIIQEGTNSGIVYLASNIVGSDKIYDASLRITGDGSDYTVTAGAVIVEKHVKEFREVTGGADATMLMPFAAPFTNMRSGHFAGNWVRQPLWDNARASFYYPYGNMDADNDDHIDPEQYVIDATQNLEARTAYLLRLQKAGSGNDPYKDLILVITGEENHNKDKFIINGSPYPSLVALEKGPRKKQLFTGGNVLSRKTQSGKGNSQNWLVGNSYTSALSGEAIAEHLMKTASAFFSTNMYIYHHGATGYETYSMWNGSSVPSNIPDIQAMSVFMIAVEKGNGVANETITIGPEYQVHTGGISTAHSGQTPNNPLPLKSLQAISNELNITVAPEDNPFVYDRTSISMYEDAQTGQDAYDVSKMLNGSNRLFQIYGTNASGSILQSNALPYSAEKASLHFTPPAGEMSCSLLVENANDFASEEVLLFDKQQNKWYDLRENNLYSFVSSPTDRPDRFEIHFISQPTGIDPVESSDWYAHNDKNTLMIRNINNSLVGCPIKIYSVSGILQMQDKINVAPQAEFPIGNLSEGIYILSLGGKTVKFIK